MCLQVMSTFDALGLELVVWADNIIILMVFGEVQFQTKCLDNEDFVCWRERDLLLKPV